MEYPIGSPLSLSVPLSLRVMIFFFFSFHLSHFSTPLHVHMLFRLKYFGYTTPLSFFQGSYCFFFSWYLFNNKYSIESADGSGIFHQWFWLAGMLTIGDLIWLACLFTSLWKISWKFLYCRMWQHAISKILLWLALDHHARLTISDMRISSCTHTLISLPCYLSPCLLLWWVWGTPRLVKLRSIPFSQAMPLPIILFQIVINVPGQHICSEFRRLGQTILFLNFYREICVWPACLLRFRCAQLRVRGIDGS